jgi:predicted DNA-binding transcriptional regulator AlpA
MKPRRFISYQDLVACGIFSNRVTLQRAIRHYGFPGPYKIGRRVCWDEAEVDAWMESRRVRLVA